MSILDGINEEFKIIFTFTPIDESDMIDVKVKTSDNVKLTDGKLENLVLHSIHQIRTDRYNKNKELEKKDKKPSFFKRIFKK